MSDATSTPPAPDPHLFQALLRTLRNAVHWNRWVAAGIFFVAILGAGVALYALTELTARGVADIASHPNDIVLGIFILLRSAAFAGIVGGLLYGLLNSGRAALDQAERYKKRQMAAHFMHYLFVAYEDRIGEKGFRVAEVIDAIDAWSRNVESAYTKVKIGGKGSESWAAATTKNGTTIAYGKDAVRGASRNKQDRTKAP